MTKEDIERMIDLFQMNFEENASDGEEEWYEDIAQGLAFATNAIPKTEKQGRKALL